jgi:cytidyltransferase-like protein
MSEKIIAVSGAFDPIHAGHVRLINDAAAYGMVVVILNSDEWLRRKKGYVFMPWEERKEILMSWWRQNRSQYTRKKFV